MPITVNTSPISVEALPLDGLTTEEKLTLHGRVWDSILADGPPPVPEWHHELITERLAAAEADPGGSLPLEEFMRELAEEQS